MERLSRPVGRAALLLVCFGFALGARAEAIADTVHSFQLNSGTTAAIGADGSLIIADGGSWLVSGRAGESRTNRRLRKSIQPPFVAVVAEGAAGGQRGFSANRDDDGDGLVDEDRLDGRDNDGDGRVDEDFAAISDAMVVVDLRQPRAGAPATHLEYYHWSYPWLRSTVFMSVTGPAGEDSYRLELSDHNWHPATLESPGHSLAGKLDSHRVEGFVAQPRSGGNCGPAAGPWVGAIVRGLAGDRVSSPTAGLLEIPVRTEPVSIAICVAETWPQLNYMLNEAARAQEGAEDKVTGRRAGMIVAPQCAQCRLALPPEFSLEPTAQDQLVLTAELTEGRGVALDPDLFRLSGRRLGAPTAIQWVPVEGPPLSLPWGCLDARDLATRTNSGSCARLYAEITHHSAGQLRFLFDRAPNSPVGAGVALTGAYLDGRSFESALRVEDGADSAPTTELKGDKETDNNELRISLSPSLLEGFPNPFRDQIQLRFQIPATVGEAFVWGDEAEPPADVDLMAAPPWQSGSPSVSVRIYSLNGQELVTLFAASQGPGLQMVQWDGTDQFGRKAASGTYFCKLQIDKWSVTKRLVFLR